MWWWHGDWNWWNWLWMSAVMVAFWGALIWLVFTLLRADGSAETGRSSAEDVLAERFARGELDEDDYRQRLDVLRGDKARTRR